MFIIGGLCFFIVGLLNEHILSWDMSLLGQMFISAIVITFVEFESGAILNIYMGLNIWDYSGQSYNLLGQICPLYSFFWFLLSLPAILLDDLLRDKWFGDTRKEYKIL